MFNKKECFKCQKKINNNYEFCPYCGNNFNQKSGEDWGMLGKDDVKNESNGFPNFLSGGLGGKMLGKMIGSAMMMLEKELSREVKNPQFPKSNVELFINGKRINPENIQVMKKPMNGKKEVHAFPKMSEDKMKKFANLPKKEPLTNIRRFSNKIIYEIIMPEVKTMDDILVNKLENSIEIKAFAKDKVYAKSISLNFPLIDYSFSKGKLILELEAK